VLSRGRTIYNGAGGLVPANHFASRGYPPQPGYNVADHLLDIASEPTDDILADSRTLSVPLSHNETSEPLGTGSDDDATAKEKTSVPPNEDTGPDLPEENILTSTGRVPRRSTYASTFLTQFQVLCGREWKILLRSVPMRRAVPQNQPLLQGLHIVCCAFGLSVHPWRVLWGFILQNRHYHCRVPESHWMSFLFGMLYAPLTALLLTRVMVGVLTLILCSECIV
jgi:hypothetical protein